MLDLAGCIPSTAKSGCLGFWELVGSMWPHLGVSHNWWIFFERLNNKDHNFWGSILGSTYFLKLPLRSFSVTATGTTVDNRSSVRPLMKAPLRTVTWRRKERRPHAILGMADFSLAYKPSCTWLATPASYRP